MRNSSRFLLIPIATMVALSACKSAGNKSKLDGEVSGLSDRVPSGMGTGFETDTQQLKSPCVGGYETWAGAQSSQINYVQDLDLSTLQSVFSGGANVGVRLSIFDVKGAADVAVREAVDEYSSSMSLNYEIQAKKKVLSYPYLSAHGQDHVKNGRVQDSARLACGNEFFNTIVYGGSLFVNAKFYFQTKEDKMEFKGNAAVSLAAVGEIGGNISHLSDRLKRNSKVTIYARQVGGDVEKLSTIFTTNIITCSLADFDRSCLPMLNRLVEYAKNDFPVQFPKLDDMKPGAEPAAGWAQLKFISTPYDQINLYNDVATAKAARDQNINGTGTNNNASNRTIKFVPAVEQSLVNDQIEDARINLFLVTQRLLKDKERVATLLANFDVTERERDQLEEYRELIEINNINLQRANQTCVSSPSKCIAAYSTYTSNARTYGSLRSFGQSCFKNEDLIGTKWKFKRWLTVGADPQNRTFGKIQDISEIELMADGTIGGAWKKKSLYEARWETRNCQLRFLGGPVNRPLNDSGQPAVNFVSAFVQAQLKGSWQRTTTSTGDYVLTSLFDSIESKDRMTGVFIYNTDFRHILERM